MEVIQVFSLITAYNIIEGILRLLVYISVICVAFKGVQALNIYINKNNR